MKQSIKLIVMCVAGVFANTSALADAQQLTSRPSIHAHKPTLPVKVSAAVPSRIVAGQPVTFAIDISSVLDEGVLEIQLVPLDGLQLVSPTEAQHFNLAPGGVKAAVTATVLAPTDGTFGLSVEIRHVVAGKSRSVVRGITLRVGDTARASLKIQSGGTSEPVVSMPARESIRR